MSDLKVSFPKPCGEQWDAMRPEGCNRFCDKCDKTIHDLSQLKFEEIEELASSGGDFCVRAQVLADGIVAFKPSDGRIARRIVATIGASVGILATASPATAGERNLWGAIRGEVIGTCGGGGSVSATASDGRVYNSKIGGNGRYKVKRLPAGIYDVKIENGAYATPQLDAGPQAPSNEPKVKRVIVEPGRTSKLDLNDPNPCIVIGMLQIEGRSPDAEG